MPTTENAGSPAYQVIFTGDDFGLSPAVNTAIVRAYSEGVLTCASLMAAGPAWQQAVALAKECPDLCVGLHLTLIQGQSVLPPRQIPALVDQQGNFPHNPMVAGLGYYFSRQQQEQIAAEGAAQIERLLAAGIQPWFLNGHLNIHLHPAVWPLVRRWAKDYAIPAVRLAKEDLQVTLSLNRRRLPAKFAHALIFAWLSRRARAGLQPLEANDHVFGLLNDGGMDEAFLLGLLPRLAPGVTEIYCHPAAADAGARPPWPAHYRPQAELAALTSPLVADRLRSLGYERLSFRELVNHRRRKAGSGCRDRR
ncbi:MAG: hopanoid biosynthesis-associated protein HpnK [Desulfobacca sp.]|uniref:hopanoid biosynthesis-associated protein HpnK n=1 Tax=Desulfobacca sp. TaxID=2067990 RepID=UPI00404B3EB5